MGAVSIQALHHPWGIALAALLLNLPFGYWRAACRKFSFSWFVAVHVPVILIIGLRLLLGVAFRFATVPLYVLAFVGGQFLGAEIRRHSRTRA